MVPMELSRIVIRETSESQLIFLKEKEGDRSFPIIIGLNEAIAINRGINKIRTPRPMTHDLLQNVISALDGTVKYIVVNKLENSTFYAKLIINHGDRTVEVDSRPSDAIALAVSSTIPIYVEEAVLDEVAKTELE